jgi:hypothetical protein
MRVVVHTDTLASIKKIKDWFVGCYGIKITQGEAVDMAVHTATKMSSSTFNERLSKKLFQVGTMVTVSKATTDRLRQLRRDYNFLVDDIDVLCNAIVQYRAATLPLPPYKGSMTIDLSAEES